MQYILHVLVYIYYQYEIDTLQSIKNWIGNKNYALIKSDQFPALLLMQVKKAK